MDLRLLRTFRLVAQTGSVSAAAEAVHLTQPALSRQVQQLERQIGFPLFSRVKGRLVLSAAGRIFLEAAERVLASADTAAALAASLADGRLARVSVAAPTTTLTDVLAPFLATLRATDPLITVEEAHYTDAIRGIASHIDLAIVTSPPPRRLSARQVAVLPIWAYMRAEHRLAEAEDVRLQDLSLETLIVLDHDFRPRQLLDEALVDAGLAQPELVECSNPQVAQALSAAGRGVAVVSDDPRFDLVAKKIEARRGTLALTLYAAWDPAHHAAEELHQLAGRLGDFCAERYGSGS